MIKKLRRKFILIAAAALLAVILVLVAAINGLFFYENNEMLERHLSLLLQQQGNIEIRREKHPGVQDDMQPAEGAQSENAQPGGTQPEDVPPADRGEGGPRLRQPNPVLTDLFPGLSDSARFLVRGCLVYLDESDVVTDIRGDLTDTSSREELEALASRILGTGKEKGWYETYKYRVQQADDGTAQTMLAVADGSSVLYSVLSVALISGIIALVSFIVVLLIIIIASKRAVEPVAESEQKQKEFVTDASHELKTPLTVISANNEIARLTYGDSQWFDSTDKQVKKMNGLVRSLITMARMDEDRGPDMEVFSLSDAVYDTAETFRQATERGGRRLEISVEDDIYTKGEEGKLRQLVSILMDNAVKYCDPDGVIRIDLSGGRQAALSVSNTYAAVGQCDLDRLFDRFYRGDASRAADGSYGLGLSIARAIVMQHKGTIEAKAEGNDRICFRVMLKRQMAARSGGKGDE